MLCLFLATIDFLCLGFEDSFAQILIKEKFTLKGDVLKLNSTTLLSLLDQKIHQFNGLYDFGLFDGIDEMEAVRLSPALHVNKFFCFYGKFVNYSEYVFAYYVDSLLFKPFDVVLKINEKLRTELKYWATKMRISLNITSLSEISPFIIQFYIIKMEVFIFKSIIWCLYLHMSDCHLSVKQDYWCPFSISPVLFAQGVIQ